MKRWPTKPLKNIATVVRGVSFDKTQVSDLPSKDTVPILRAGNIQTSLLTDSDLVYVSTQLVSAEQRMRRGDLAICMSSGSPAIVGKTAHLENDWDGSVGAFCAIVRFATTLHHRFGSYWFRSPAFFQWRDSNAKGANIQNLRRSDLECLSIPVPPLAEQERIVKLLDEADELRKLRVQADNRTAQLLSALFHEMFGDPDTNPKDLPVVALGTLLSFRTGKLDSNAAVKDGAYPFFTCSREDFTIDTYAFDCEALLLAGNNATADYSVKHYKGKFNAYQRTYVLNLLNPEHSYGFMQQALQLRLQELKRVSLGTNTKYLTLGILKNIKIPLPTPAAQKEFAQRVAEIRDMETTQTASRQRSGDLFQSMLHRAFNGEL